MTSDTIVSALKQWSFVEFCGIAILTVKPSETNIDYDKVCSTKMITNNDNVESSLLTSVYYT